MDRVHKYRVGWDGRVEFAPQPQKPKPRGTPEPPAYWLTTMRELLDEELDTSALITHQPTHL